MNTAPLISHAIAKGWIEIMPAPTTKRVAMPKVERRRRQLEHMRVKRRARYAIGLTATGALRKRPTYGISKQEIATVAERDGVGVTAIYNRLKRTGRLTLRKRK